jgi:hypothetical protein
MPNDVYSQSLKLVNTGARIPAMQLVKHNPSFAAAISKMVEPVNRPNTNSFGDREMNLNGMNNFNAISDRVSRNIRDSSTVMQMLPDMELPAQVLISCILSPKDMMSPELTYQSVNDLVPPEVMAALIEKTKKYFEEDYKITSLLPKMLRDILFEKGSYPIAVIPENSVDEAINGQKNLTLESLSSTFDSSGNVKNIGLLGKSVTDKPRKSGLSMEMFSMATVGVSLEDSAIVFPIKKDGADIKLNTCLEVVDNPSVLKLPLLTQRLREQRVLRAIGGVAMESVKEKLTDMQLGSLIYKSPNVGYKPLVSLKTNEQLFRSAVGNPLIMHINPEAVIPVHAPGSPENQVGFFILIDPDGHPISTADKVDISQQMQLSTNSNGSFASSLISQAKAQYNGMQNGTPLEQNMLATRIYTEMVERDLIARLNNGQYGNGVELAKAPEVYRIMLARTLSAKNTQLLFIPVELMTYMAFKYNPDGTGMSLLEGMQVLSSLRTVLMMTDVHASLRNSIGRTNVNIKLDPLDPNPLKTIEMAQTEVAKTRTQFMPLGLNNPIDLNDWLGKAGFEITFEGHPGIPEASIEFTEKNSNYVKPDQELSDNLRKQQIMGFGLNPATVDATYEAEFATSIVTNNLLLAKRVQDIQAEFNPLLTDHHRKVMIHSQTLRNDLRIILQNNFDIIKTKYDKTVQEKTITTMDSSAQTTNIQANNDEHKDRLVSQILHEYIVNFNVSLPKPNTVTLANQMESLKAYTEALDVALDAYLNEKIITSDTAGDISPQMGTFREAIKAYFIRDYMAKNGILTELNALLEMDDENKLMDEVGENNRRFTENIIALLTKYVVKGKKAKDLADQVVNAIGGVGEGGDTSSSDDGGDNPEGGGGDDEFGLSGLDEPNSDEPDANTEPEASTPETPEDKKEDTPEDKATKEEPTKEEPEANLNGEKPAPEDDAK